MQERRRHGVVVVVKRLCVVEVALPQYLSVGSLGPASLATADPG